MNHSADAPCRRRVACADLVVIDGDPATRIGDVRRVELVFRQGVAYDPRKLIESVRGKVAIF